MAREAKRLMTINLGDERRLLTMRAILGYEAEVRGLSMGQALLLLLVRGADIDNYPPEIRGRLDEIHAAQRARATRRCLEGARAKAS